METIDHINKSQEALMILQNHPDIKKDPKMNTLISQAIAELEQAKHQITHKIQGKPEYKVEKTEKKEFGQSQ
jgi:hypothetical protein